MDNHELFAERPVANALAALAIPTIISQLIIMVYNLADTFFIGRTDDPYKIAAASLAYVLFFLLNAIANLFGIGGGSLLSRLLGQHKERKADSVCALSFYGTLVVVLLYSLICFVGMNPILTLMGASANTLIYARQYTFWCVVIGGIPASLSMAASHLLRSAGCGKEAGIGLSMGSLINMVLDPLFMFVILPAGLEVEGAAIATMLSNCISLVYYLAVLWKRRAQAGLSLSVKMGLSGLGFLPETLEVGFPSAVSTLLVCVSIMLCNNLASSYGDIPVAAIGIVKKLEMLPHNVGTGLCQGMIPLVAYNYSSGDRTRMHKAIRLTRNAGLVFTGGCILLFETLALPITLLFIKEPETVSMTVNFLRIMVLATPLTVCNFHMCYTLQAMGKGPESLFLSICRQGIFNIPLLLLMNRIFGLYGVIWTQILADAITLAVSVVLYRRVLRKMGE